MNYTQIFSLFSVSLVLVIGICEIQAQEPFKSRDCLRKHFQTFFIKLENKIEPHWETKPEIKIVQQFLDESDQKTDANGFAEVVKAKIDIIIPMTQKYGFQADLGLAIVNLCGDINRERKPTCSPYNNNIAELLGDKLQTIFEKQCGRVDMGQYKKYCGDAGSSSGAGSSSSSTVV